MLIERIAKTIGVVVLSPLLILAAMFMGVKILIHCLIDFVMEG